MHFRFYRGTRAAFLNISTVDIWTRQVFLGERTCTLHGVSQSPWPLSTGCSSHLLPQSWQPKMCPDIVGEVSLGKPVPGWEPLGWSECRVSSVFRERNTPHLAWVVEVELRWADGIAEAGRWTQQYLGAQTCHDDPVLNPLSASLLQYSTCSEEGIWSCVGDTHSWVVKDNMWNVKFSFTLL